MTVDPLVSVEWLKDHLGDPQVRAVDVRWYLTEPHRGRADYDAAHLPGAVFMDIDGDLAAPRGQGPFSLAARGPSSTCPRSPTSPRWACGCW